MSSGEHDYEDLGLIAGLEIHQQLDTTTKLFCACPTKSREPTHAQRTFFRYLHPTASELGEIDLAALEESRVGRRFEYLTFDTTCLVEEDEEPPSRINEEALEITLQIARLFDMTVVDQAHIMRKIVVDGSNTTGFQRSALIALNGHIDTSDGPVGIADLLLEEESAQRVEETEEGIRYSLDRLGIPLVEIGTEPDLRSPAQAREAAETIGMFLRSTGQVKRGLGTIRQDVNVSIADGARIELKGVQQLDAIDELIEHEVDRQLALLEIQDELHTRGATVGDVTDVSQTFESTESGVLRNVLDGNGRIQAVRLIGFAGLVGQEIQPNRRLGTEFADYARQQGAGGIFHSDELPGYGITREEVAELRSSLGCETQDAVVIVAADTDTAKLAIDAVAERARKAIDGVPEETRAAEDDGTSRYLRPLPGAARMYPETDVPPAEPDPTSVAAPELITERVDRYERELGIDRSLARQVAYGSNMPLFEDMVNRQIDPMLAAQTLENTLTKLRRDEISVEQLSDEHIIGLLEYVEDGEIAKEGIGDVLAILADEPELTTQAAIEQAGLESAETADVREIISDVVERNADQVADEGMGAFSGLMGECMEALRGRADGEVVSDMLREEIQRHS